MKSVSHKGLEPVVLKPSDFVLTQNGHISATTDDTGEVHPVSRMPRGRMAAASWDEIAQALRNAEEGKSRGADVELRPGGELVLVFSDPIPRIAR